MVLIIAIGSVTYVPFTSMEYSPPMAFVYQGEDVQLYGNLQFENGTYAIGIELRLFATDELHGEYVMTDNTGRFYTADLYESGQLIVVYYNETRLSLVGEIGSDDIAFVEYTAHDQFYLGTYLFPQSLVLRAGELDSVSEPSTRRSGEKQ